jgi:hypothetical protein
LRKPVVLGIGRLERCALDAAVCAAQINATVGGDTYYSRVARAKRGGGYTKAILYVDLTTGVDCDTARGTSKQALCGERALAAKECIANIQGYF